MGPDPGDEDDYRTETQKEWAAWAASGYRKWRQPRSMLIAGGIFFVLFIALLLTVFLVAAHRGGLR
jgi:hypothetical protein